MAFDNQADYERLLAVIKSQETAMQMYDSALEHLRKLVEHQHKLIVQLSHEVAEHGI